MSYYVVLRGFSPGIYSSWQEAQDQVSGYSNAKYKKFSSFIEAEYYYKTKGSTFDKFKKLIVDEKKNKVKIKEYVDNKNTKSKQLSFENFSKIHVNSKIKPLEIWTDGSAIGNGKKNCKSGYSIFFSDSDPRNRANILKPHPVFGSSNQRAELYAIYKAIKLGSAINKHIIIYTDSMYSIECIEKWSASWKRNNWKNSKNEPVKHSDIIKKILKYTDNKNKYKIRFVHIKSHRQRPSKEKEPQKYKIWYGNYKADSLAKQTMNRY
jgi:ribonuclease HI